MTLNSRFQAKCFVIDELIYAEYGILAMNGGLGAIAPEAFEK